MVYGIYWVVWFSWFVLWVIGRVIGVGGIVVDGEGI